MSIDTPSTEAEIEAEAKRWAAEVYGRNTDEDWPWASYPRGACRFAVAHARYVLERQRPEDVEAVAKVMVKAAFPNLAWDDAFSFTRKTMTNCARATIAAYGPLPAPPQITDADVLLCAEAWWSSNGKPSWHRLEEFTREQICRNTRACLEAFFAPPPAPVDPRIAIVVAQIRAACEGMDADAQRVARDVLAALDGVKTDG